MPELTEEEKRILRQAYEIKERIKAEELEAGELSLDEAVEEDERAIYGPDAANKPQKTDQAAEEDLRQRQQRASQKRLEAQIKQAGCKRESEERPKRADQTDKSTKNKQKEREKKKEKKPEKAKKKKGFFRRLLKLVIVFLIIAAILLGGVYGFLRTTIAKTNYKPYETAYERQADVLTKKGVTNILLIGTDTRVAGSDDTRSDAMIVVSINPYKHRLVMTSILRDSYVNIPGYGQNRINEAYSRGGPALLIQTIEENYKLGIDYYAQVDFFSFVDVIDAFGGITITIEQPEVEFINGYVSEYNHIIGAPEGDQFVDEQFPGGEITLTGRQALGYARIRKIGTDFARTQRQRTVMNALLEKVKKANVFTIYKAVESILPDISTDISDSKMCSLLMQSVLYLNFDIVQARVPADGTWSNAIMGANQEVLAVDFEANKNYLQSTIYD